MSIESDVNCSSLYSRCDGSWGLAVVHKDKPDEIVVACNGSPMVRTFAHKIQL